MIEKTIKFLLVALGITISLSVLSWAGIGNISDTDKDKVTNAIDNCINEANPNQSDVDHDDIGNVCDPDDDDDGIPDYKDPFSKDPTK